MAQLVKVAERNDIARGGKLVVELDDMEVAVFNVDDEQYYAVENICSHDGGSLGDGRIVNSYEVECPRHGARFDIRTGKALAMPAFEPIEAFSVTLKDGDVFLMVDW